MSGYQQQQDGGYHAVGVAQPPAQHYTAEDNISPRASLWQKILYIINTITLIFGVAVAGVAIKLMKGETSATIPSWTLPLAVAFGFIVFFISICGFWGAKRSVHHIANGSTNWFLRCYFLIVFVGTICQFVVAVGLLSLVGVINNAKAGKTSEAAVVKFEDEFVAWAIKNAEKWKDVQTFFGCCGYNSTAITDPTATSDLCPWQTGGVPSTPPCKEKLLDTAASQAKGLGIAAIFFVVVQIAAILSTTMLLCCINADK